MTRPTTIITTLLITLTLLTACTTTRPQPTTTPTTPQTTTPAPNPDAPTSIAALGDSITRGFNACTTIGDCPTASWATGDDPTVNSHAQRLQRLHPHTTITTHNYAANGAKAADLPTQAATAAGTAQYITLQIGGNDACDPTPTPPTTFADHIDTTLHTLTTTDPDVHILITSIPDLHQLWENGHTNDQALWVWGFDICKPMLANAASDAPTDRQRRDNVTRLVDDYNNALADTCAAYPDNCRWDGGAVHDTDFTLDDISAIDYFHPSRQGQALLADLTWQAGYHW